LAETKHLLNLIIQLTHYQIYSQSYYRWLKLNTEGGVTSVTPTQRVAARAAHKHLLPAMVCSNCDASRDSVLKDIVKPYYVHELEVSSAILNKFFYLGSF
jgi:hypothetical protein